MFATEYSETPEARRPHAVGGLERRLTEAAVMLAFAIYLLEASGAQNGFVTVRPDGEHAKIFDIVACLTSLGFVRTASRGTTPYGGIYKRGNETIVVDPSSGKGDVEAQIGGRRVIAECKGAVINSTHPGQRSRT
ncbi:MAG TPA: hypothetical protein VFO00_06550, partial [Vitreimonas sp.]|nr:hypothetical protein [Vitreimonas sp.]